MVCFSEASKFVMSYVAAVCGKGQEVNKVKEQLLQSNPVLEGESSTSSVFVPITLSICHFTPVRHSGPLSCLKTDVTSDVLECTRRSINRKLSGRSFHIL